MIEEIIKDLKDRWGYDTRELNDIRSKLIDYGLACVHDSAVREEALELAMKDLKEPTNIIYLEDYIVH